VIDLVVKDIGKSSSKVAANLLLVSGGKDTQAAQSLLDMPWQLMLLLWK